MLLKVCGITPRTRIGDLAKLSPDLIGFIFYPKSKRYVGSMSVDDITSLHPSILKVGVFVNEDSKVMLQKAHDFDLDYVQLHGDEELEIVRCLTEKGIKVIKVLHIKSEFPVETIREFENEVSFFLFDTQSPAYGGTGKKFDWSILTQYPSKTPFILSGGIDLNDIETIQSMNLKNLAGIDVNSRFEIEPGKKDIGKLKKLKSLI